MALSTTISELMDMPMAAPQEGIIPAAAKGSAIKLYSSAQLKSCCIIVWVCWALRNNTWIKFKSSLSNSAGALDLLKSVPEAHS